MTTTTTKTNPNTTINAIGMPSVAKAIEHYGVNIAEIKWAHLTESDRNLGGFALAMLNSDIARLDKKVTELNNKVNSGELSTAKVTAIKEDIATFTADKSQKTTLRNALVADGITTDRQLAIYAYGLGKCLTLEIQKDELDVLMEKAENIRKYAKLHNEKVATLADNKRNKDNASLHINLKNDMQELADLLSPNVKVWIKGQEVSAMCSRLLTFTSGLDKNWNAREKSGLNICKKETVLRTMCELCGLHYAGQKLEIKEKKAPVKTGQKTTAVVK